MGCTLSQLQIYNLEFFTLLLILIQKITREFLSRFYLVGTSIDPQKGSLSVVVSYCVDLAKL